MTGESATTMESPRRIPLSLIIESPTNPRKRFDPGALKELAESMTKTGGNITPILVRPRPKDDTPGTTSGYELVCGARRYRAAKLAKLPELYAMVRELSNAEAAEIQTIENLHREDLHPLEAAEGYRYLANVFAYSLPDIAAKVGKSQSYVAKHMKLTDLIPAAKEDYYAGKLTFTHALLLARLTPKDQTRALEYCYEQRYTGVSFARVKVLRSVEDVQEWIKQNLMLKLSTAPWKKEDEDLLPSAGSCMACPKRTGSNPELFDDVGKEDTCMDGVCYHKKMAQYMQMQRRKMKERTGQEPIPISGERYGRSDRPGRENWEEVPAGKAKAAGVVPAIIADGKGLGRTLFVKIKKEKPAPRATAKATEKELARHKKRQEEERWDEVVRRHVFEGAVARAPGKLTTADLQMLARAHYDHAYMDDESAYLAEVFGVTNRRHIAKLKGEELVRFVMCFGLLTTCDSEGYEVIFEVAKRWGVDAKKVRATLVAKHKKGPKCEGCGCTEVLACPGGCAWDASYENSKRYVCTNCRANVQKADADARNRQEQKKGGKKAA